MAIIPLKIPQRYFGQPIPVAPDMNEVVDKVDELVDAVNAGLATSNAIVGGPKFVRYTDSRYFGVGAADLTLDRLDPAAVLPGNLATVINSSATPTTTTAASVAYVAAIVPAGTPGAFAVRAYSGAPAADTVLVAWQEVVDTGSFTALLASELAAGKADYAGLDLRPLLIKIIGALGTGKTIITTTPPVASAPAAPTAGQVDDTADTFSFVPNPAYPSFAQYKVNGLPGVAGAVVLDATNSYVSGPRIYVKVVGAVSKGGLAVYVAGSGNVPDGAVLTNADPFTGQLITPPTTTPALTAALAISVATLMAGSPLTFTVTAGGGTSPYSYAVVATNNATGATTVLGSSASGSFTPQTGGTTYTIDATVTDAAGKVAQAVTRTVQVTAPQAVNQLPVADAGQDLTIQLPTSSVALLGTASDPDAGDTLTYLWRPIAGPNTPMGLPATTLNVVVSNLVAGTYQFGFQATDQKGGKSPEDFVVVTVQAAATAPGPTLTEYAVPEAAYQCSSQSTDYLGGKLHNTFAYVEFETFATQIDLGGITALGAIGFADQASFGVFIGPAATIGSRSTFSQDALFGGSPTASPALVWIALANVSASGSKRLRVLVPAQCRGTLGTQEILGTVLLKIRANASLSFVTSFSTANPVYNIGQDSIASSNPANPWVDAWPLRLRERLRGTARVVVNSIAGASLLEVYGSGADKAFYRSQYGSPATSVTNIFIYGANDAGRLQASAADFGGAYGQLLDDMRTQYPNAKQVLVTPFTVRDYEPALAPLRTAATQAATARAGTLVIDGPQAFIGSPGPPDPGKPDDGIHPNSVQHASIENFIWGTLQGVDPNLFSDDFPGTTLNQRWLDGLAGQPKGAALVVVNNALQITATVGPGHQQGVTSALPYSLLAYAFQSQIGTLFVVRPESVQYVGFHADGAAIVNGYQLAIGNGRLVFAGPQFVQLSNIAYDVVAHKWVRFRGVGSTVIPETSPDGVSWTNPFGVTHTAPFSLASVRLLIGGGGTTTTDATNWPTGTALGTATFLQAGITTNTGGGSTTTPPPAISVLQNSEFTDPVVSDISQGWLQAQPIGGPPYYQAGGTATIANGVATVDATNWLIQKVVLVANAVYKLEMKLNSITSGNAQVSGPGNAQINTTYGNAGTGATAGVYSQTFTSSGGDSLFAASVNGTGTATLDYLTLTRIS